MVCVAAFIILCLISVFVAVLSIFRRDIGKKYWEIFKKAWHCVFKKVRLQKCDTNFKDDVKNSILSKIILKHPKWVKPLSVIIEIVSILIVFITVWSIVIAIKSLLALWVFGTCNVSQPSQCGLGSEMCSVDASEPKNPAEAVGRWFAEWGEIFGAIPDRLKTWNVEDYVSDSTIKIGSGENKIIDIMDPGCSVCMQSFRAQLNSGVFRENTVYIILYPLENGDGGYKFKNSLLLSKYLIAARLAEDSDSLGRPEELFKKLITRLFTERDAENHSYQTVFNNSLNHEEAVNTLDSWLKDFGFTNEKIKIFKTLVDSEIVDEILKTNKDIVENKIHIKGIPTFIENGKKFSGLYE